MPLALVCTAAAAAAAVVAVSKQVIDAAVGAKMVHVAQIAALVETFRVQQAAAIAASSAAIADLAQQRV